MKKKRLKKKDTAYVDWLPVEVTYSPLVKVMFSDGFVCVVS